MDAKYLKVSELSQRMSIAEQTLNNWRSLGKGPRFIRCGRLIRYAVADVESWLEDQRRRSTSDPGRAVEVPGR